MSPLELEVSSKRCIRCLWSSSYHNWTPPGDPVLPDIHFCKNRKVTKVAPDCQAYCPPDDAPSAEEG
ncbi:hypothetical protein LCGC14_1774130 [marine sediment metagenome]|uniref:Uncharacterized protein n=1 Tax=marine sediment metagenome TaxID=412755 RepID=A0A0F9GXI1_9ZZZZ